MKAIILSALIAAAAFPAAAAVPQQSAPGGVPAALHPVKDEKPAPAPQQAEAAPTVVIDGFRSARFGATEQELVPLIAKDLGIAEKDIRGEDNSVERTHALVGASETVMPDSGRATVAYILGATSKRLMQVNVVWTAPVKDKAATERLANTANTLRDFFIRKGTYAKNSLAANAKLPDNSVLVFRGADEKGRLIVLHLIVNSQKSETDGTATLVLSYIEKPGAPDVFKLAPSAF